MQRYRVLLRFERLLPWNKFFFTQTKDDNIPKLSDTSKSQVHPNLKK